MSTKTCNRCKEAKPLEDYARMSASPDGRQYKCRPCSSAVKREWERKNPERMRLYQRNSDIRRYGITPEEHDAMLAAQGGVCAICRQPEPRAGHNLHIDHCHETGKVRGLLCGRCNRALGMFKDDVAVMQVAIDYLLQANAPSVPLVGA